LLTGTSFNVANLLTNSTYEWRVKSSCSDFSSIVTFSTGLGTGGGGSTSCSSPSNTNTVSVSTNSAQIEWEAVTGAANYTVQYRLETATTYITLGTFTAAIANITNLATGQNYVWRVKANCSPYGSDVQFSTASLRTAMQSQVGFQIFPNPATEGYISLQSEMPISEVKILDSYGKMVLSQAIGQNETQLDIQHLSNGIYFVLVTQTGINTKPFRLVVSH
jgi:hypothetical protein